eukprot:gnl/TRDRNA2_/TRDRNA2_43389_c0_seq1.p1 gnl/TRDRNA2_/TRDRNA2_43389_c0~~gnl/TRDRNA2_/TRDRNA2_43389_c0_seq1.p1  ORF type:complete len:444 (+),score=107.23 gnl/TRDRNA2_/TRDRNA2_43389_c0_seq1:64-1395(+)
MAHGWWEVDAPKAKAKGLGSCASCGGEIQPDQLRFKWCVGTERSSLHANCAVSLGRDASTPHAKVLSATIRKSSGLYRIQQDELNAIVQDEQQQTAVPVTPESKSTKSATVSLDSSTKAETQPVAAAAGASEAAPKKSKKAKATDAKAATAATTKASAKTVELEAAGEPPASKAKKKKTTMDGSSEAGKKAKKAKVETAPSTLAADATGGAAHVARVTDVVGEPLNMLGPIVGVMDLPRMDLIKAATLTGVPHVDSFAFLAAENGTTAAADDAHGLDAQEAGVLNLYTMESELYSTLNARLRDRERPKLKPFFPFLQLMLLARAKLPKFAGTVWRGVKGVDLRKQYPKGKEVYWWAFSSTTKELSTLQNPMFLGTKGVRTVFNIQVLSGVDICRYSVFQGEQSEAEVLLFPGTKLRVVDSMDMGHNLFQVQLQEVAVPVQLIK